MTFTRPPLVLMYHGFTEAEGPLPYEDDPFELLLPATRLREQLAELRRRRYRFLDIEGYLAERTKPVSGPSVLITIDDGMRSVIDVAAPILEAAGVPSVLYVSSGLVTGAATPPMAEATKPDGALLTADELVTLPSRGMELGVHGWDHSSMTTSDDAGLRRHTVDARQHLAGLTGTVPRSFAYPYGHWDDRAVTAVRAAGFDVAFSLCDGRDQHTVDRVDVKPGDSLTAFRIKLLPGYRMTWRATRRLPAVSRAARSLTWRMP